MAWVRIPFQEQWQNANDVNAAGFVIKTYLPGTTTPTPMAIDKDGNTTVATVTLNADGLPEVSGNEVAIYIDRDFKYAIYENATDASNDTNAFYGPIDNVKLNALTDLINEPVADYAAIRNLAVADLTADSTIQVTNSGIAGPFILRNSVAHGLSDNGGTIIVIDSDWYAERVVDDHYNVLWFGVDNTGDSSAAAANVAAIQAVLDTGVDIYFPPGDYYLNSMLKLKGEGQSIYGAGSEATKLIAADDYLTDTLAGFTAYALIYHGLSFGVWNDTNFRYGGNISGLTLECESGGSTTGLVSGIIVNRMVVKTTYSDLWIFNGAYGIRGTNYGWGTSFNNVTCIECTSRSISLTTAYNGCTFNGCHLWGRNVDTARHLEIREESFGCSWNGGFIEECDYAVWLEDRASIVIIGCDFEKVNLGYVYSEGQYSGATLLQAQQPSMVLGCTFVNGSLTGHGIHARGARIICDGNYVINRDVTSTNEFYYGEAGANIVNGFPQMAVSERNTIWAGTGWSTAEQDAYRYKGIVTEQIDFSNIKRLVVGAGTTVPPYTAPYGLITEESIWSFNYDNARTVSSVGNEVSVVNMSGYCSDDMTGYTGGVEQYVIDEPGVTIGEVDISSNNQGSGNVYGRVELSANVTATGDTGTPTREDKFEVNALTQSAGPVTDNALDGGTASKRWKELFAVAGTINTSDEREKTQFENLTEKEKACALEVKQNLKKFKWIDAVSKKGDKARLHFGIGAQTVVSIFNKHGLDATNYGLLCHDVWYTKDGVECLESMEGAESHDRYGIRYEELLCFVIASI